MSQLKTKMANSWEEIDSRIDDYRRKVYECAVKLLSQTREGLFIFKPFSIKQKKVLTWWCDNSPVKELDGIICDGAIRSGKTVSMSLSFVMWAMEKFNGHNFALCGKTISSLRRNVIFTLKLMLKSRGYSVKERRTENLLIIKRGDTLNRFYLFGGKDESSALLIQGITLAGVFFDEVALMPRSFVEQATARCSVDGSKFWFNCNPEGPEHWFYKQWIMKVKERNVLYLHFTMDDNLALSEKIKERYKRNYVSIFYERFVLGLWVVAEGLVYPHFSNKHTEASMPSYGEYYISVDYGTQNPFSAGLWCISKGRAYRIKEYYYSGRDENHQLTDEEYYEELVKLINYVDEDGNECQYPIQKIVVDPSAASFIACIKKHGRFRVLKARNDVLDGIRRVSTLLKGERLFFSPTCKDCIKEFKQYRWDPKSKEDEPLQVNDHAMDDVRYFVNTVLAKRLRWEEWK